MVRVGNLWSELRRRRVLRTAALYVAAAWVALQGASLAFPGLGIPDRAIRHVWIGALFGLPLVLLFAWRYQITSGGVVRTAPRGAGQAETLPLGRRDYLALGALLLIAGTVGYRLVGAILEVREPPAAAFRPVSRHSVAVLPLQNVTADEGQEFFVAGMQDALITTLSKIGALRVISRSSAAVYRNVVVPARQIGQELGVAYLVEGSVFRSGDHVQINVQLVDALADENRWSESYERDLEDVLTLQKEVARDIAQQIQVELTPDEMHRLTASRKVNPGVYETYLRGMYHLNQYTPEGVRKGLALLQEAVATDPGDPLAYAGLAQGYTLIGHGANPPTDVFPKARRAAEKALELDPLFAEAHAAMAEIRLYYDWDWKGAERSFRRALQLDPNLEFSHAHYGWYLQLAGDLDGAVEQMRRAQQIAPLTPIFTAWLGWLYWDEGRHEEAVAEAQRSLDLNPAFPWGLYVLGGAYAAQGRYEEALATYRRLLEVDPRLGRWGLGETYADMGRHEDARRVAAQLAEDPGHKDLLILGVIHGMMGDRPEALRWLETARDRHVDWFPYLGERSGFDHFVGKALDSLRAEPRYQRLFEPLGLPGQE